MSTDRSLIDFEEESHSKWIRAFSRWYHTSKRDWILENLREGICLSPKNSRFLAAILDGSVKAVSGKQGTQMRVKNSIINNKIDGLRATGMKREEMLVELKEKGLLENHIAISGLNQRIDRPAINPVQQRMELDKKLSILYETVTKEYDN